MSSYSFQWGQEDKAKFETDDLFLSYKNLLERKIGIHWHAAYLQKYIQENIIPFWLRIKLFPHFHNPSQEFKKKWEDALTNCSLSLMSLFINEHKTEMSIMDNELQTLGASLSSYNTTEGFAARDKLISDNLAKRSKEIITNKEKKTNPRLKSLLQ